MDTIKILSPVHVGTGEKVEIPCFYKNNSLFNLNRYSFLDVLEQIPIETLMEDDMLNALSSQKGNKRVLYDNIRRYCKYNQIKPMYCVRYESNNHLRYDVSEQIKVNGKPYIPGSSIKGALLTAWFYHELKQNYNEYVLEKILESRKSEQSNILDFIGCGNSNNNQFVMDLQSCLVCRDIYFNNIELYDATRIGCKNGNGMPLGITECIQPNQQASEELFKIDDDKIENLFTRYQDKNGNIDKTYLKLLNDFDRLTIFNSCNEYLYDVLQIERTKECVDMYDSFDCGEVINFNDSLNKQIKFDVEANNKCCYIRIGESTSYFNKSISLLIRNKSPKLFEKYFDSAFSPNDRSKKQKPNYKTIPKTRVIYKNDSKVMVAGYIKVNYD